jgi:hypothetical protein
MCLEARTKPHVHQKFEIFGQILHPQWPAQTSKMGKKMALVLEGLRLSNSVLLIG